MNAQGYSLLKGHDEAEEPAPHLQQQQQQQAPVVMLGSSPHEHHHVREMNPVVEMQPRGNNQLPTTIQVVQPPQANDHLYFTVALICACLLCGSVTGITFLGAVCLVPALICAAVGADFNKEGKVEEARNLGLVALICNIVVIVINTVLVLLGVIGGIIVLALLV